METYPLTTARASKLLGAALILWTIIKAACQQLYWPWASRHWPAQNSALPPLSANDTYFVVVHMPEIVPGIVTGLILMLFGQAIQKILK